MPRGFLGNFAGLQGTVTVSGAGSTWTNGGTLVVGGQGTGTLDHPRRRHGDQWWRRLHRIAVGSTGTVTVTGPGSSWNNSQAAGSISAALARARSRSRTAGGSSIPPPNNANIGNGAGSQGTVTVTGPGSTWSNQFGVNIGNSGTGTLTIADGGSVTPGLL